MVSTFEEETEKDFFSGDSEKWHRQDQLRLHHRSFGNPAWSASSEETYFHDGKPFLHGIIDCTTLFLKIGIRRLLCPGKISDAKEDCLHMKTTNLSFRWSWLHPFFHHKNYIHFFFQQCLHTKTTNQASADYDYIHIHFFNNEEWQIVCWKTSTSSISLSP